MRTAFFGGSFDPVHAGHVALVRAVLEHGLCDRVLVVPAFAQPFKPDGAHAAYTDRVAMARLAFAGDSRVEVSEIERELARTPSYTADVLRELMRRNPEERFALLIGGDSLSELHLWHDAEFLVRNCEILTFPRRGAEVDGAALRRHWPEADAQKLESGVLDLPFLEISATELRKKLANGENTANFIPGAVRNHIETKKLYHTPSAGEKIMEETTKNNPAALAELCAKLCGEKLAENIVTLKLDPENGLADYFVLCTADSEPQLRAVANHLERGLRETLQLRPRRISGEPESGWILADFNAVVVHIMTTDARARYDLESLWGETPDAAALDRLAGKPRKK